MRFPTDEECKDPDSPIRYELWGRHEFDMDVERNILIHFIKEKGLEDECVQFIKDFKRSLGLD